MASSESQVEFVYSRVNFDKRLLKNLLDKDGILLTIDRPELTFYKYAASRGEARALPGNMRALAAELLSVADELDFFLDTYETDKWED